MDRLSMEQKTDTGESEIEFVGMRSILVVKGFYSNDRSIHIQFLIRIEHSFSTKYYDLIKVLNFLIL